MNIFDVMNSIGRPMKEVKGEVGIEIEVEGSSLPVNIAGWRREEDGSLRGESCEYVLKTPCKRDKVDFQLGKIDSAYEEAGTRVTETARQSTHIHINVQEMELTEIYNFILLFLIFEQPLVSYCGKEREGNLFCLRSIDAEGLLTSLEEAAYPDKITLLNTDGIRYSAVNVNALFKYGSLEFRSLKGTSDFVLIENWVNLLLSLKDAAKSYENPIEILNEFSMKGVESFSESICAHLSLLTDGWEDEITESMWSIQSIVYGGDWEGLREAMPVVEEVHMTIAQRIQMNRERERAKIKLQGLNIEFEE